MKIHELANITGLTPATIRFYEKEGLLDSRHVQRFKNNYRDYYPETINHLRMIKKLQSISFSIGEMKNIFQETSTNNFTLSKSIEIIEIKLKEIEQKQLEYESIHTTLEDMLEHKISLREKE